MNIRINFDGSCKNVKNGSSPMGVGIAIFTNEAFEPELSYHAFYAVEKLNEGERGTNNAAEWLGCINAFQTIRSLKSLLQPVPEEGIVFTIQSDSEVITKQFNGDYGISNKNPFFHTYLKEAKRLANEVGLEDLKITHVLRKYNKEADILSKLTKEEKDGTYNNDVRI